MASVNRTDFIAAMRNVASSVSVVTTDGPAGCHGATVSAFCSVSADPPTILVCLNENSRIAACVRGNGVFGVNILPDDACHIADRFAGKHDHEFSCRFKGIDTVGVVPHFPGATMLRCTLDNFFVSGSHLVCFGRVNSVVAGSPQPLAYLAGNYHKLSRIGAAA